MDRTSQSQWQQIDAIFDDVLDAPESEREKLIRARCGDNAEFAKRVRELLQAAANDDDIFDDPSFDGMIDELDIDPLSHPIGKRIGKYTISGLIGQGGMGAVYLAERDDKEFRRKVAIKLISPIFTDEANSANFRRERQILAKLNHPSIAAMLDGGTTETGTPYLIMEYVEGVSLTEYSQKENLTVRRRIDLFLEVCEAVKFAHQNLIIHRDLKPANILVTADGKPKLLDFGIAKLLNPELLDVTTNFTVGANILTPNYASPEQLKGENITTASDVYGLGVILYELLTGRLPLDLKSKSLPDILKTITEETPVLPSIAVTSPADERADSGGGIPTLFDPQPLRGDLDTIVLKALAKDPNERYQTVEAISSDLRRHLSNLPILARQPSSAYRLAKFVRRNRTSVILASVIFGLLLGLVGVTAFSAYVSRKQARESLRRAYSSDMNLAMQSYENANLSQMTQLIQRYENTDLRGWEWNFLYNLAHPKGRLLTITHPAEVWNVTFSPDSTRMATACADGIARIYEVPGGRLLASTQTPEKNIWRLTFSPDGQFLATASGDMNSNSVKVWNARDGTEALSLKGHEARVRAIGYSPDGHLIATGSRDGTIRIWNAENGTESKKFNNQMDGKPLESQDLEFTPDGKRVIVAHERGASIWDVSTGKRVIEIDSRKQNPAAAISPDGSRFALSPANLPMAIYESSTGKKLLEIGLANSRINDLAFSPDGKLLASAGSDRTVRFFETEKGSEMQNLRVHFADAWSVVFSPDGKFVATAGTDFNTYLFDSSAIVGSSPSGNLPGVGVSWSAISADRTTIAMDGPGSGGQSGQNVHDAPGRSIKVHLSAGNADSGSFSPDGKIVASGNRDGTILLRATENGTEIRRFKAHECGSVGRVCIKPLFFTPDGGRIVSGGSDGKLKLSNTGTGQPIREIYSFDDRVSAASISPDGRRVFAASYDGTAKLFDLETGEVIADLGKQPKVVLSTIFSPDGKTLVTGSSGVIRFWNPTDGKLLDTLIGNAGVILAITFTPDGTRLASASGEGVIGLWDTQTKAQVLAIRTNSAQTNFLAFAPDGNTLISHSPHENIRLWDASPIPK